MLIKNIICPVSFEKTDGNVVRVIAFIVIIFLTAGLVLKSYLLLFVIAADFTIRAFTSGKYSFTRWISVKSVRLFKLNKIPIDAAPKKFAAELGMIFSLTSGILMLTGNLIPAYAAGIILLICALLEGIFSFCAGCYVYTFVIKLLNRETILKESRFL